MLDLFHSFPKYADLTRDELSRRFEDPVFRKAIEAYPQMEEKWFENHGVFCLLKENNHPLMWAHYADKHQGYCLEFELDFEKHPKVMEKSAERNAFIDSIMNDNGTDKPELLSSFLDPELKRVLIFTKINYPSSKAPDFILSDFLDVKDDLDENTKYVIQHSIGVKGSAWNYEQEFRLIANWNSKQDHSHLAVPEIGDNSPVPWLKVTGIILGMHMSHEAKEKVTALALKYKMNLMFASADPKGYAVKILSYERDNSHADVHSYEKQEETLNLPKILALDQREIEQGLFRPADEVFSDLDTED